MKTEINTVGISKMNTKKLLMFGMILGMIFVMANSASANLVLTFVKPANNLAINGNISLAATTNVTQINATFYYLNKTGSWVQLGFNGTTGTTFNYTLDTTNTTLIPEGIYTFKVLVNGSDAAGNTTSTSVVVSNTAPTITINATSPLNMSWSATGNTTTGVGDVVINFTATHNVLQTFNCSLIIDGAVNNTANVTNNTEYSIPAANILANGTHTWAVNCTNNASNNAQSVARTLYVDTAIPTVTLISPRGNSTNNVWMDTGDVQLWFNYTDNYQISGKITNCTLWGDFNGTARTVNYTIANVSNNTNTAFALNVSKTPWAAPYHWDVNCTNGENSLSTTNASTGFSFYVEDKAMVSNFYVTNAAGSPYGFDDNGTLALNQSVIANQTNNITISINTSEFGNEWSYRVEGYNGAPDGNGTYVNITTGTAASAPSSTQQIVLSWTDILAFRNTTLSTSTTNYTILVYIYNTTGSKAYTGYVNIMNFTHWSQIYTIEMNDTGVMTVGSQKSFLVRIKNQTGNYLAGYVNVTGVTDSSVGNLPITGQSIATGGTVISVKPENVGNNTQNVTFQTVGASGVALANNGILATATKKIPVNAKLDSLNVLVSSSPVNVYKDFNTNITVNITRLNETIYNYANGGYQANISYNVSITVRTAGSAGKLNVTKSGTKNTGANGHYIDVVFNFTELNNFNSSLVGSGTVPLDINVLLDIHNGYAVNASNVDYNTTSLNAASLTNAGNINLMSPSGVVNLSAGKLNTVTFDVKNSSNGNMTYNITLSSTTYLYNVTTALTSITVQNNGSVTPTTVTFTVTPEQNGTITATIASGTFTPVTTVLNVFGSNVNRSAISPALGSVLTFNQTYVVSVPVKRLDGGKDYGATINVSGIGYAITGSNLNISDSSNYVTYTINMTPNVTGYLNITVTGIPDGSGNSYNATFVNAYNVLYTNAYTLTIPSTLTRGLNNTFNVTVMSNNTIASGNLTVTYYDINGTAIATSTDVIVGTVSNVTTVTTVVPTNAYSAKFTVSNTTTAKSGSATATVVNAAITLSQVSYIINNTNVVNASNPTDLILVNGVPTNITFAVNAPNAQGLTIWVYNSNTTGTLIGSYSTSANLLTPNATIAMGLINISNVINASKIAIVLENANNASNTNPLNITIRKQPITSSRTSIPVSVNTTVTINVTAYGNPLAAVNVSIVNSTGTVLIANLTDVNGIVNLLTSPANSDTLKIAVNNESTGTTITATNTLNVTYSPLVPYTDQSLTLYVRPSNSQTDLVTGSYVYIQAPGTTGFTVAAATDGTYPITLPLLGVYVVYATNPSWANSANVYINVLNASTRSSFANITPSVTSIPVNTSSAFTVTVANSTGNVDGAIVTLSGAGVSTAPATTNASGVATIIANPTSIGNITITASKAGYNNLSTTLPVTALSTFTSVTPSPSSVSVNTSTNITVTVAPVISGATVTLSGAGVSTSATTNASGIATFSGINATSAGTITVIASKAGYTNMSTTISATVTTTTTTTTTTTSSTSSTTTVSTTTSSTIATTTTTTTTTTTLAGGCKGDSNGDGVVSDFELLNYIDKWAKNQVSDFDLLTGIDNWAKGHC